MEKRADCKSDKEARLRAESHATRGEVDVSQKVVMNGLIPLSPVFAQVARIPPITVKAPVCELSDLSEEVQPRVENQIEHCKPEV